MALQDFFDSMEDTCEPISAGTEASDGLATSGSAYFAWSKKGVGFGQLYFYFKKDDEGNETLHCDNECMSKERVKEILCSMVDNSVFDD